MPTTDTAIGAILQIPPQALNDIKAAEDAIKSLGRTSNIVARSVNRDWGQTAITGLDAFITKVTEAQNRLNGVKMPDINSKFATDIAQVAQSMAQIGANANSATANVSQLAQQIRNVKESSGKSPKANIEKALIDTSAVQASLAQFIAQSTRITDIINRIQERIAQLKQQRVDIQFDIKADIAAKIANLTSRLKEVRALASQSFDRSKLIEYYREIDILREKIAAATKALRQQGGANPALTQNAAQIDMLIARLTRLRTAEYEVNMNRDNAQAQLTQLQNKNNLLDVQIQRIQTLEQRLQTLNAIWTRLNANNQAFDANGQLTEQGKRILNLQNEVQRELRLRKMTAEEAQKYEEELTKKAEAESKKRIQQAEREAREKAKQDRIEAKEAKAALAQQRAQTLATPTGAMDYAKNARSLKQLTDAYKNLKAVMATVDPKSTEWQRMNSVYQDTKKKIDDIKRAMGELQSQSKRTNDSLGKLKGLVAQVFSVSAIYGFIKNMVKVRGEFELQNVALRAILQNKDEADRIFLQVQQMAMQSPFSIMQLTTYTKQLAAYRIEADKLVGTTKMLADVSAGLGVDIQRLILAYGQVKSANYLRATEIRQFTEAGLNIAGELASYFSELQGRMVTVGEVMEMVTKRMVKFEDVEEVFKRVTSAGGIFYDMQKKQSESISGQLQRIGDAYSIMLNDIGKSNQETITSSLTLIREMISSWRAMVPTLMTIGGLMAGILVVKGIIGAIKVTKQLNVILQAAALNLFNVANAQKAASFATWATGIGAVIGALSLLATILYGAYLQANKLNEELGRIGEESVGDMAESILQYEKLAKVIRDSNSSYTERQDALDELNRTYKDILPKYLREAEYINSSADGYKAATEAIKEYYQAQEYAKKVETVMSSEEGKAVDEAFEEMGKELQRNKFISRELSASLVKNLMRQISEDVKSGEIDADAKEIMQAIRDKFGRYYSETSKSTIGTATNNLFANDGQAERKGVKMLRELQDYFDAYEFELSTAETAEEALMAKQKQRAKTVIENAQNQVDAITNQAQAYFKISQELDKLESKGSWTADETKHMADLNSKLDEAKKSFIELAQQVMPGVDESFLKNIDSVFKLDDAINTITQAALPQFAAQGINAMGLVGKEVDSLSYSVNLLLQNLNMAKRLKTSLGTGPYKAEDFMGVLSREEAQKIADEKNKQYQEQLDNEKKVADAREKANRQIIEEEFERYGVEERLIDNQYRIQNRNNKEYAKDLRAIAKAKEETIRDWDAGDQRARSLLGVSEEDVNNLRKEVKALRAIAKEYDPFDDSEKNKGKGKDEVAELWKKRLKALEDYYKQYENLRKDFSKGESGRRAKSAFEDLFKTLGLDINAITAMGMDKKGLVANIDAMIAQVAKERPKLAAEFEKALADTKVKIDVEISEDAIKDMEADMQKVADNFELSDVFRKLGVPIDIVYTLGGKPTTLADWRKQLEDNYKQAFKVEQKYGKDGEKAYDKQMHDVAKKEQKYLEERAKNYVKYLTESMSERAQIEIKAMQDINKIRNDETLDQFSKDQAIANRRKKMQEELTKFDFDEFKASDVYLSVFSDLETASKQQIQYVIDKLREMQSTFNDLSPTQVKAIASEIKKLQDALADRSAVTGFATNLKKAFKYAKNAKALKQEQVKLQDEYNEAVSVETQQSEELYNEKLKLESISDKTSDAYKKQLAVVEQLEEDLQVTQGIIADIKNKQNENTEEISKGEQAWKNIQGAIGKVRMWMTGITDGIGEVVKGLDSMGLMSDDKRDSFESFSDIIGGLDTMMSGLESIDYTKPFTIVTGVLKTFGGLFQTMGGFFGLGDKAKERQIKRLTEKVEDLDYAYQKLEKSIEAAYTFDDYNAGYEQSMKNLEMQKKSYEEMARLEAAKKKTDKEKQKEYERAAEEAQEKMDELKKSRIEAMGSTTDYLSEAQSFVDAWLDAYREVGDGTDALKEHWDEFMDSLVVKQAAAALVSKRLEKVIGRINDAIDAGMVGTDLSSVIKNATAEWDAGSAQLNQALKEFFDAMGVNLGKDGDFGLSDLQQGIQNITEPQAAAIEAYLNSMRFAVYRHTEQLDALIAAVSAQYGAGENPIVTELKGIRSVLDTIDRRFSSIVESRAGRGAYIRIGN